MKKILLTFLFFSLSVIFFFPPITSDLNCGIFTGGSCPANNVDLLYMKNDTGGYNNAHAELPTVATYDNVLCCNSTSQTLGNASTGIPFLNLSATTNAHVQNPSYSGASTKYTNAANISSDIINPICELIDDSCSSEYTCLVSIVGDESNTTNAHVGECGYYKKQVCCYVESGYLEVSLVTPPSTLSVTQNQTFTINATVYCRNANCGNVQGTVQYNGTSAYPDTPVNTTTDDMPLFIQGSPQVALKSCPTNPLAKDEFCNLTWIINATGAENSQWEVGVFLNSSISDITDNHTSNSTITITHCSCDITLWSPATIGFETLNPSTNQNPATGNSGQDYNITINQGSCISNLWTRGEDLTNSTYETSIGIGNLTWGNSTNNYTMTSNYATIKRSVIEFENVTNYYWINISAVKDGRYTGNITIYANESGS